LHTRRTREDERDEPLPREEATARAVAFARVSIVRDELQRRGAEPPERFIVGYRQALEALMPEERTPHHEGAGVDTEAG
jgi:hypothetical protein